MKLAFLSSGTDEADAALDKLVSIYGNSEPDTAEAIVALGGDGFMLQTQHDFMNSDKPIYGMNKGTVGFLMNEFKPENLRQRIAAALRSKIRPLIMTVTDEAGNTYQSRITEDNKTFEVLKNFPTEEQLLALTRDHGKNHVFRAFDHFWLFYYDLA